MSDNPTRETPDSRSFEERVFARFDALDARMDRFESHVEAKFEALDGRLIVLEGKVDALDGRLTTLEEKVDARLRETRPIWEAVQTRLENVETRLENVETRLGNVENELGEVKTEVKKLSLVGAYRQIIFVQQHYAARGCHLPEPDVFRSAESAGFLAGRLHTPERTSRLGEGLRKAVRAGGCQQPDEQALLPEHVQPAQVVRHPHRAAG